MNHVNIVHHIIVLTNTVLGNMFVVAVVSRTTALEEIKLTVRVRQRWRLLLWLSGLWPSQVLRMPLPPLRRSRRRDT
jgi:hypothetical protein